MSGFTGPQDHLRHPIGDRPAVHRRSDAGPTMAEVLERFGARWDISVAESGRLVAVLRDSKDGVQQTVVSAWELAGFGDRLAEADRAMKEST